MSPGIIESETYQEEYSRPSMYANMDHFYPRCNDMRAFIIYVLCSSLLTEKHNGYRSVTDMSRSTFENAGHFVASLSHASSGSVASGRADLAGSVCT